MEQPLRLLVVDDDPLLRRLWQRLAGELGLETLEAGSPEHARQLLESGVPAVIVLDVLFPEGTGLDFLHELRQSERWKQIPVIVCSAVAERDVVLRFAQEGICHYLLKPFTLEQARERLRYVLHRWGLLPAEGQTPSGSAQEEPS
jgi:CheY-like chemotaxis protein